MPAPPLVAAITATLMATPPLAVPPNTLWWCAFTTATTIWGLPVIGRQNRAPAWHRRRISHGVQRRPESRAVSVSSALAFAGWKEFELAARMTPKCEVRLTKCEATVLDF